MLNGRDLGGIPTALGPIRAGRLWRSGAPAHWSAADRAALVDRGLAFSFDLRSHGECLAAPSSWPRPVTTLAPNAAGGSSVGDPVDMALLCSRSAAQTVQVIHDIYADLPRVQAPAFAVFYQGLAAGRMPALVHCAVGKDRTGVAIAILLDALQTPRAAIFADYLCSNAAQADIAAAFARDPRTAVLRAAPAESWAPLMSAQSDYLEVMFDSLDRQGGATAYVERAIGRHALAQLARKLTA